MENKSKILIGMFFVFAVLLAVFIYAETNQGYCCERLQNNGAWCQSVLDESQCATGTNPLTGEEYKSLPTSCDQTSYCTLGTCLNQRDGFCSSNVPQQKCVSDDGGTWFSKPETEVPQCQLGCCTFGKTAQYVTETRCSLLSADSGLQAEFNSNIDSEAACIDSIESDVEGACVYQTTTGTTKCQRLTKSGCDDFSDAGVVDGSVEFYTGQLCSSPDLGTICVPTERTTCSDYNVYFVDSCGNTANIYDSAQIDNMTYWSYIQSKNPSCDDGLGNKNSPDCGACEPISGSICAQKEKGQSVDYGNNICKSLDCGSYDSNGNGKIDSDEKNYRQGESWCAQYPDLTTIKIEGPSGEEKRVSETDVQKENLPGSRYVKLECRSGEIVETACDPYRNEVCAQSYYDLNENGREDTTDYKTASCVENRWQGCLGLDNEADCIDQNYGDCQWISYGVPEINPPENPDLQGVCVPKFAPGFNFWQEDTSGSDICDSVSTTCTVKYETGLLGSKKNMERIDKCVENCYCIPGYRDGMAKNKYEKNKPAWHPKTYEDWIASLDLMCSSLGDCGSKVNYIGQDGLQREDTVDTSDFR